MKKVIASLVILLVLVGCTTPKSEGTPTPVPSATTQPESTVVPNGTETPGATREPVIDYTTVVNENISYVDTDGIRHYSLYGGKFLMSVQMDFEEPLVITDAKYEKVEEGELITISVDYEPKGCTQDTCSNFVMGWSIYNEDYKDNVVQANKEYSPSVQNGYFALINMSIESVLDEEHRAKYTKLTEDIKNGNTSIAWWE